VSRKLKLGDFLAPGVQSHVRTVVYNWLWLHAGQDASYETLGRVAWGDWGAEYARTQPGRVAITKIIQRIRRYIAATRRDDAPVIKPLGNNRGYRLDCDRLAAWGPMVAVYRAPVCRATHCLRGHLKEFKYGEWVCVQCHVERIRRQRAQKRQQAQAVQP
jgi:hypothetical protein